MDNNKPAMGQHQAQRGRGEEVGINDERRGWWWRMEATVVGRQTDRQADRAVMRLKVREIRRKHCSTGCHSVRSANHRALTQTWTKHTQHRNTFKPAALTEVMKLKLWLDPKPHTLHSSPASALLLFICCCCFFFSPSKSVDWKSRSCIVTTQNKTIIWAKLDLLVGVSHAFSYAGSPMWPSGLGVSFVFRYMLLRLAECTHARHITQDPCPANGGKFWVRRMACGFDCQKPLQ